MRRVFAVACLGMFVLFSGHSAAFAADNAKLEDLKAWVDKYPAEHIDGQSVWDNKELGQLVDKFIGPKTKAYIFKELGHEVMTPVENKNDILTFFVCKAHACPDAAARFFVDIPHHRVFVCWSYQNEQEDLWLSEKAEPKPVGAGECLGNNPYDLFAKLVKD